MELLYIYINRSNIDCIEKQGFHLSMEYNVEYREEEKEIHITRNKDYYNIFKQVGSPIQNITAVVGANGAGKTTFLKTVDLPLFDFKGNQSKEYKEFNYDRKQKSYGIKIYKIDNNLVIYQNINEGIKAFLNGNRLKCCELETNSNNDIIIYTGNEFSSRVNGNPHKKQLEQITHVYVTNSNYLYGDNDGTGFTADSGVVSSIELTERNIDYIGREILKKNSLLNEGYINNNDFIELQQKINNQKDFRQLQGVLQYLYIDFLSKHKRDDYWNNIKGFKVTASYNLKRLVAKDGNELVEKSNSNELSKKDNKYLEKLRQINRIFKEENTSFTDSYFIETLYNNLIIEVILSSDKENIKLSNIKYESFESGNIIDKIISNKFIRAYYKEAYEKINYLKEVISGHNVEKTNKLPNYDGGYDSWLFIELNKENYNKLENNLFKELADFIRIELSKAKYKTSFILKYLKLDCGLSSGERSTLNIFSWIYSIPLLNDIVPENIKKSTEEHVLLLLDEIELYAHPEWQRNIIKKLYEDVNFIFKQKVVNVKVQIILATHSPLVLSDIPTDNLILMKKGKVIDKNELTFGANIYDLYKDEFILDASVGEFARDKINKVIAFIDGDDCLTLKEAKYIMNNIGEPVLRKFLQNKQCNALECR